MKIIKNIGLTIVFGLGLIVLGYAIWYGLVPQSWKNSISGIGSNLPVQITIRATATPATDGSAGVYGAVDALKDAEANQADAAQNLQNMQSAATQAANNLIGAQATATEAANGVTNAKATVAAAGNTLIGAPTPTPTQTPLSTIGPKP